MANTTDYAKAHRALISIFNTAMHEVMRDDESEKSHRIMNRAFALAKKYGWDWEADDEWTRFTAKATGPEIIAFGLSRAIDKIRL